MAQGRVSVVGNIMVGVVVGSRLGLEQTSGYVLGARGQLGLSTMGRAGENVFVNAATGNLILNNRDEFLVGLGTNSSISRTYNSQGQFDGDNNDGWRISATRRVSNPSGTPNTAGSTVIRTDWDGSQVVYTWNDARDVYLTTEGAGAYDSLEIVGTEWIWTDGDSQITETYGASGTDNWRLLRQTDTDGNSVLFTYNSDGYISRVATARADGTAEYTDMVYVGANLTELKTTYYDDDAHAFKTRTRTRYAYDGLNRLSSVTVDLSPNDNTPAGGGTYVTSYTYSGTSTRVASISQTDGSRIEINYEPGGAFRVESIIQTVATGVTRKTKFDYVSTTETHVTGPDDLTTKLTYDDKGQLTKIEEPAATAGGTPQVREFIYDNYGNVTRIKTSPTTWTEFRYFDTDGDGVANDHDGDNIRDDHNGLWTRQYQRQAENIYLAASRTYNARDAVLTETRYLSVDTNISDDVLPGDPLTTRYVYDSENHLRYTISPTGSVVQYDYTQSGLLNRTIAYTAASYDVTGLPPTASVSLSLMNSWAAALPNPSAAEVTETVYDYRGQIDFTAAYSTNNPTGGANGGGPTTRIYHQYDAFGRLVSRRVAGMPGTETFIYDGMDRMVAAVDFDGNATTTAFYDVLGTTLVRLANGLNQISTFNRAGERLSYTETERGADIINATGWPIGEPPAGAAGVAGWPSNPAYAADSRWSWTMVNGPNGRQVVAMETGQIQPGENGGGAYTNSSPIDGNKAYEYVFYFRKADLTRHSLYFGMNEHSAGQAYVENATTGADNPNPYFLAWSPAVQQASIDDDRWYKVVAYVLPQGSALVAAGALGGVYDAETGAKVADVNNFRWNDTRPNDQAYARFFNYYDQTNVGYSTYFLKPEVREVPTNLLNTPTTPATQYRYDRDGRLRTVIDPTGQRSHILYDRVGRKVADIDADGSLVEYRYDLADRLVSTTRYATWLTAAQVASLTDTAGNPTNAELSSLRPAANTADSWTWQVHDDAGRLTRTADGTGAVVSYSYDGASRLIQTTAYATRLAIGSANSFDPTGAMSPSEAADRVVRNFFDADGRQIGTLDAEGFLTQIHYDLAGRVVKTSAFSNITAVAIPGHPKLRVTGTFLDLVGSFAKNPSRDVHTWSFYDGRGLLKASVNGEGEVTLYEYTPLGHVAQTIRGRKIADVPTTTPTLDLALNAPATVLEITTYTRNHLGQVLTEAKALADGVETITYSYDSMHRLVATFTDRTPNGGLDHGSRQRYDLRGRLIGQLSGRGVAALLAEGTNPSATAIDSVYRQWGINYAYDDAGRLISRTSPDGANGPGNKTTYFYDADGNLAYEVNGAREVVGYTYDALNRRVRSIAFIDRVSETSYAALKGGAIPAALQASEWSRTSPPMSASITALAYSVRDEVVDTIDPLGLAEHRVYDAFGDLRALTTAIGPIGSQQTVTAAYNYDRRGSLLEIYRDRDKLDDFFSMGYDAFGRVLSSKDNNGNNPSTTYDRVGRTKVVTDALGFQTTYSYDARGNVLTVRDRLQNTTEFTYDAFNRTQTVKTPSDLITTTKSDDLGHTLRVTDGGGRTTDYAYDLDGNLITTTNGLGQQTTRAYDSAGRISGTTDAAGRKVKYTYDGANRTFEEIVDPDNLALITRYSYDGKGRRIDVTDPSGVLTKYEFDLKGQVKAVVTDPHVLNLRTEFDYDRAGNVTVKREGAGTSEVRETRYDYDKLDRLVRQWNGDETLHIETNYSYDRNDNVTLRTDRVAADKTVTTRYAYDAENRLVFAVDPAGGVTRNTYDPDGRIIRTVSYANALAPVQIAGFGATPPTVAQLEALVTTDATDQSTVLAYDTDGRLTFRMNALGQVTRTEYDGSNNAISRTDYATLYTVGATPTQAQLETWASSVAAAGTHVSRFVYDAAGRQTYSIDAGGHVTAYGFDGAENLTKQSRFAILYTASGQPDTDAMLAWTSANGADVAVTRIYYDAAGRQQLSVNALGYVSRTVYDDAGHVLAQTRYAAPVVVNDGTTNPQLATLVDTPSQLATARVQTYMYDTAGRLIETTDPVGVVTKSILDALGRQSEVHQAFGTAEVSITRRIYDDADRLVREERADGTPDETVDIFDYDGLSRSTAITNGAGTAQQTVLRRTYDDASRVKREERGATTRTATDTLTAIDYTYDGIGRRLRQSQFVGLAGEERLTTWDYDAAGRVVSAKVALNGTAVADTRTTYDSYGNMETVTDPRGNIGRFFHDALNRLVWQVDPEGYLTQTTYNLTYDDPTSAGMESRETVTRYMVRVAAGWTPASGVPGGATAVTQVVRDKLDRVIRVIDAEGKSEVYGLNAFGDRVSMTNKIGGVTTYAYDKLGRVETEIVSNIWNGAAPSTTTVINRYTYDARGNLETTVEASGRPEARTTTYAYDKLDRLKSKTGDAVPSTTFNSTTRVWTTVSVVPVETIRYDSLGNVTETIAASGARTLFYYDRLGRKTAEVAETGRVTDSVRTGVLRTWSYDAANNPVDSKVYNRAIPLPAQAEHIRPAPSTDDGSFRQTTYEYDRNNRLVATRLTQVRSGNYVGGAPFQYETQVTDIVSRNSYDASGNVVSTTDGRGYKTLYFYDKMGRQSAKVDAEGFLTTWSRDAEGNPLSETRYANPLTTLPTEGVYPTTLPASSAHDRITTFTYDLNGRRKSETRVGVVSHSVAANGVMSTGLTHAVIQYEYDGMGNVVRKVEANLDAVRYEYDDQGRVVRTIHPDVGLGERRVMTNTYDGLDAVIRTTDGQDGAADAQLRSTVYTYGAGGRLISTATRTNSAGQAEALFTRDFAYDLVGNLVRESYQIRTDSASRIFEGRRYDYDAQSRIVLQSAIEVSTTATAPATNAIWTVGDRYGVIYNVHGEVVGKGVNEMTQETFDYDSGGRMWRSNTGDGVTRLYVHDQNGNVTLTIGAAGYDLRGTSVADALTLISTPTSGGPRIDGGGREDLVTTFTGYDSRGLLKYTVEPNRRLRAANSGSTTTETTHVLRGRSYNAFGEVASETDARGSVTEFTYNTMGRLTLQKSPLVIWVDETGAEISSRPEERRYYDVSGRLIGTRDANGNLTRRTLQAGSGHNGTQAVVTAEFAAGAHTLINGVYTDYEPTGITRHGLNVFGDITKVTRVASDAAPSLNMVEERNYDLGGRMIGLYRSMRAGATGALVEHYGYDGLGRRVSHTNTLFMNQAGSPGLVATERTRYDLEGRVASFSDYENRVTQYGYQWQAAHTTQGMGETYGGWTQTTTHVSGKTQTVDTDYFGREIGKSDYGNHVTERRFDTGGRLVYQIMRQGVSGPVQQHLTFAWHNSGLIAAQRDHVNATLAEYEYDAAGSRNRERYQVGSTTHQDTGVTIHQDSRVQHDALGRMIKLTDTSLAGTTTVDWKYDQGGNIRHMKATYPILYSGGPAGQDFWYKYDTQNRFTVVQGQLIDGDIQIGAGQGVALTYDNLGNRASATRLHADHYYNPGDAWDPPVSMDYTYETRENYTYTADGYLSEVWLAQGQYDGTDYAAAPATGNLLARDVRDQLGRLTFHYEYSGTAAVANPDTGFVFRRESIYDRASMLVSDTTWNKPNDNTQTTTTYSYVRNGQWVGVLTGTTTFSTTNSGNNVPTPTSTTYDHVWYDDARQSLITHDTNTSMTQAGITNALHTSTFHFDGNGRVALVNIADGRPRNVHFVTDASGQVMRRTVDQGTSSGPPDTYPWTRYLSFDGMQVGEVTNDGPSGQDYAAGMNAAQQAARARGTANGGNPLFQNGQLTRAANFDQAYENLSPGSVAGAGSAWTVRDGDTLQGIAAAVWGDASLWYLIADHNGLTSASILTAGQTLTVPAKVANVGNTSFTFRPYDPNQALGDLSPTQVKPPKNATGGCGGTGQIIAIIIAVAVAAIVAPYAAAALANLGAGATVATGATFTVAGAGTATAAGGAIAAGSVTAAGIASGALTVSAGIGFTAGAIAGAAASIASQAFSIATGMQDSFDWKGLALSTLSGGIGGGMSLTGGSLSGNGLQVGAARGAINSTLTQGIGVATGLQDNFSWTNVAVSAVVSGVSSAVAMLPLYEGASAFSAQGMANSLVSGGAGAFAGAATRSILTGTSFGDNLIAVLPDVIGSTIGNAIAGGVQAANRAKSEEHSQLMAEQASREELQSLGDKTIKQLESYGIRFDPNKNGVAVIGINEAMPAIKAAQERGEIQFGYDSVETVGKDRGWADTQPYDETEDGGGIGFVFGETAPVQYFESFWVATGDGPAIRFLSYGQVGYLYSKQETRQYSELGLEVQSVISRDEAASADSMWINMEVNAPRFETRDTRPWPFGALDSNASPTFSDMGRHPLSYIKNASGEIFNGFLEGGFGAEGALVDDGFALAARTIGSLRATSQSSQAVRQIIPRIGSTAERTSMFSSAAGDLAGVERASQQLLDAVGTKRAVTWATPGSDAERFLNLRGAEAAVFGLEDILLRPNPSKAAVLEEFLHGTQHRLGVVDRLGTNGFGSAETHVKDFMIRHQNMLGLSSEDIRRIQTLRDMGL